MSSIVKLSVNDPNTKDGYNLVIGGNSYNLIKFLSQLSKEENEYLQDALSQAQSQKG